VEEATNAPLTVSVPSIVEDAVDMNPVIRPNESIEKRVVEALSCMVNEFAVWPVCNLMVSGMSAEDGMVTGPIIGVALEVFDGTKVLSEAVIDQLADNETPKEKLLPQENKIDDGCYYGGGRIDDEANCVPIEEDEIDIEALEQRATEKGIQDKEARVQELSEGNNSTEERMTTEGKMVKIGKIIVFVNLGYARLDSIIQGGELAGNFIVEEGTGRIKAMGVLDMNDLAIENVRAISGTDGRWYIDENGIFVGDEINVKRATIEDEIKIGTESKPIGITIYDQVTGAPYCLSVSDGAVKTTAGVCSAETQSEKQVVGAESDNTSDADMEPPVITLNGSSDITIPIGVTYSDPGAQVDDNINHNLGYSITVNGEDTSYVQIDTSTESQYIIIYSAVDQAGNIGTATRYVSVAKEGSSAETVAEETTPLEEVNTESELTTEEDIPPESFSTAQDEPVDSEIETVTVEEPTEEVTISPSDSEETAINESTVIEETAQSTTGTTTAANF